MIKFLKFHTRTTTLHRTQNGSFRTLSLVDLKIFQHHLDLASLVIVLASVLDLVNESSHQAVGHVGWHGLATSRAVLHSFPARSADNMSGRAAWQWKLSRNVETNRTLQLGLYPSHRTRHRLVNALRHRKGLIMISAKIWHCCELVTIASFSTK